MITQTIREALLDESVTIPGYVYVVRDGEVIFYVGISQDPAFRLCQHVGVAGAHDYIYPREILLQKMERGPSLANAYPGSPIGATILENAPESLGWSFDIYEKEDAIDAIKRIRPDLVQLLPHLLEMMAVEWYEQRAIVESALIEELHPCLNWMGKRYSNPLPSRYVKRTISNDGITL